MGKIDKEKYLKNIKEIYNIPGNIKVLEHYMSELVDAVNDAIDDVESKMSNPMTTANDIIIGGEDGVPTRLAKGTQGQVLQVGENGLEYGTPQSGGSDLYQHDISAKRSFGTKYRFLRIITNSPTPYDTVSLSNYLESVIPHSGQATNLDGRFGIICGYYSSGDPQTLDDIIGGIYYELDGENKIYKYKSIKLDGTINNPSFITDASGATSFQVMSDNVTKLT